MEANSVTSINIILRPTEEKTGKVQEDLTIEQDSGDLLVINKLAGTSVVIDNQPKGSGSLKITDISAGIHELKIGMHKKNIRIYSNYLLKVQIDSAGIAVLNDQESLLRQAKEAERRQKEEAREKKLREEENLKRENERKAIDELRKNAKRPISISGSFRRKPSSGKINDTSYNLEIIEMDYRGKQNYDMTYRVTARRKICKFKGPIRTECFPVRIVLTVHAIEKLGLWGVGNNFLTEGDIYVYWNDMQVYYDSFMATKQCPKIKKTSNIASNGIQIEISYGVSGCTGTKYEIKAKRIDSYLPTQ